MSIKIDILVTQLHIIYHLIQTFLSFKSYLIRTLLIINKLDVIIILLEAINVIIITKYII
jgi:hypothetical protein